MIEWILVGLPVAVTALVFSLAVATDPHDLVVRRISVPDSVSQRGYPTVTIADLLQDDVTEITRAAASSRRENQIEIGTDETTADQFASIVNVLQPIRATQRLLGMVDHLVDIDVVEHRDKTLWVHLRVLDGDAEGTIKSTKTISAETPFEDALNALAHEIVVAADPYAMAAYLYNTAINQPGTVDFKPTMKFLKTWLPDVEPQHRPWLHNLLGMIAARSNEPDMALAQYQEALSWQRDFAPAQANWGHLLAGQGDLQGAIEHYRAALAIDPDLAITHVYLAEALVAEQRFGQAQAQLGEARTLAPDFARIYEVQAKLYDAVGLPDNAATERRRAQFASARQPLQTYYDAM